MNCLEAQSKIMAFIDDTLPDEELREFIKHVKNCPDCAEELEIYYTLIVGMKELDESENVSTNFTDQLYEKMDDEMTRMNAVKRIATSTIVFFIAAIVAGLIWIYSGVLGKVYSYDQRCKLNEQPKYMYAKEFKNKLFKEKYSSLAIIDMMKDTDTKIETDEGILFLSSIKLYNLNHETYADVLAKEEVEEDE